MNKCEIHESFSSNKKSSIRNSKKSFSLLFSLILMMLVFYPLINSLKPYYLFILLFIVPCMIFFFKPNYLYYPNLIWNKFNHIFHMIFISIILFSIFIVAITTKDLITKLFRTNPKKNKFDIKVRSYPIKREDSEKNKIFLSKQF